VRSSINDRVAGCINNSRSHLKRGFVWDFLLHHRDLGTRSSRMHNGYGRIAVAGRETCASFDVVPASKLLASEGAGSQ